MSWKSQARACSAAATTGLLVALLPGVGTPGAAASLAGSTSVTPTTTTLASAGSGAATTLAGLSVDDTAPTVQAVVSTSRGTLTFPEHTGLTLAYGYAWSGSDSVGFTGSVANINAALDDVQLVGDGTRGAAEIEITAFAPRTGLSYSPSTGHYYEYVAANGISWTAARAAALARTLHGESGYLATVPNAEVNSLLAERVQNADRAWIGGTAVNTPSAPIKRTWSWADGPRAGQVFTECTNISNTCARVPTTVYSGWRSTEPNNFNNVGENAASTNYGGTGEWNDFPPANGTMKGYLVEYGDQEFGSSTSLEDAASASSTVTMAEAPGQVVDLAGTPGAGSAELTWAAPADLGGMPLTGYQVKVGDDDWTDVPADETSTTIDSLSPGVPVTLQVRAVNGIGEGPASSVTVTPEAPPNPDLQVTAPTNSTGLSSDDNPLVGMSISKAGADPSAVFQVTVATTAGTLDVTLPSGVTLAYGNQATGTASVTMVGTLAGLNEALAAVRLVGGGFRGDATITVSGAEGTPGLTYNASNQHFYEYVPAPRITWAQAKAAAEARTYQGLSGYLATVPDQATNDLIRDRMANANYAWLGLRFEDVRGTGVAAAREYRWDGGPLAGQLVTACKPFQGFCNRTDDGSRFTSWKAGEPNNDGNRERRVVINWTGPNLPPGKWNDVPADWGNIQGYVVEYGDLPVGSSTGPETVSASQDLELADAPTAVRDLSAEPGDGTATITFTAPADDGGRAIEEYFVSVAGGDWVSIGTDTTHALVGLANGATATIYVYASNGIASSPVSTVDVTPNNATTPGPVTDLVGTPGDRTVFASWQPPADTGNSPITGYQIKGTADGGWDDVGLVLSAGISGPDNGVPFEVFVRAVNAIGPGEASSVTVTPAGAPYAPTDLSVVAGDAKATVSFTPGADNGAPITSYVVTATLGRTTVTAQCAGSPCEVTGLTNGKRYTFTVAAVNSAGTGPAAGAGGATPKATPAVGTPDLVAGDRQFTVTWDPVVVGPSTSPLRGWQVGFVDNTGTYRWFWVTPTAAGDRLTTTMTGVFNGRDYAVSVRAIYRSGIGPASPEGEVTLAHWFADPLSPAERAALIDVPANPKQYAGPLAQTVAYAAASTGAPAMAAGDLAGRQLQQDQAVTLQTDALFAPGTFTLTAAGQAAVDELITSLTYVGSIRCEGYVDHGLGLTGQAATTLSNERARIFCSALKNNGYRGGYANLGYGASRPAVVGGSTSDRADNNRLVVRIVRN